MSVRILNCDVLEGLKQISDESVHMVCTSPPYFGLRSYLPDDHPQKMLEVGLEASPEAYIAHMVEIFREVRRTLRDDGSLWVNIGDSFCSTDKWGGGIGGNTGKQIVNGDTVPSWAVRKKRTRFEGIKPKDLIGIPWMLAFALRADGWWLRRDIIWAKANGMPDSAEDRAGSAHEYIFHLTKSATYYYDHKAVRLPPMPESVGRLARAMRKNLGEARLSFPAAATPRPANRHIRALVPARPTSSAGTGAATLVSMTAGMLWNALSSNLRARGSARFGGLRRADFPRRISRPCQRNWRRLAFSPDVPRGG